MPCRELSFKKGDFLDLLHSIDDHWLEARLPGGGSKGNIPRSYVKVRSGSVRHTGVFEFKALITPMRLGYSLDCHHASNGLIFFSTQPKPSPY
jgi:hypothetical protein